MCLMLHVSWKLEYSSHFGILSPLRLLSSTALGSKAFPKDWRDSSISVFMKCSTFFILANNRNTTTRSKKNVPFFGLDSLSYAADRPHRKDKTIAQNRRAKTNQAKRNKQAGEPRPPPDDANSSHALSQKRQDACARQGSKQLQSQWRLRI